MEALAGIGGSIGTGLSALGGSASTASSVAQGFGSAFDAISAIGAGKARKRQFQAQALAAELEAEESGLAIIREAIFGIAQGQVAAAAAGVDPTIGTPATLRRDALDDLDTALADLRYRGHLTSVSLRAQGKAAETQGYLTAAGTFSKLAQSVAKRGGPTVLDGTPLPARNPLRR